MNKILYTLLMTTAALSAFENAEHMAIGDSVHLQCDTKFKLPNGLELTYGEIVALAGDFFAILECPISQGVTQGDQKQRFLNTFDTLAKNPDAPKIALQLVNVFHKTLDAIQKSDKKASEVYAEIGGSLQRDYNVITGGGSFATPLFPLGTAVTQLLSPANWDHFVPHALAAYQAGHSAAIDVAIQANQNIRGLERAYAMNAFACHYLSDAFSAGHMRTPRKELSQHVELDFVAALLMDYMHGEDCLLGLKVKNQNGDEWTAFGDSYYFDPENAKSREILEKIMQNSADEVYFAFKNGYAPKEGISVLLPELDSGNASPLFVWDQQEGALKRRCDINDLACYEWTSSWWGWTTLIDLSEYYAPLTSRQKALHEALLPGTK